MNEHNFQSKLFLKYCERTVFFNFYLILFSSILACDTVNQANLEVKIEPNPMYSSFAFTDCDFSVNATENAGVGVNLTSLEIVFTRPEGQNWPYSQTWFYAGKILPNSVASWYLNNKYIPAGSTVSIGDFHFSTNWYWEKNWINCIINGVDDYGNSIEDYDSAECICSSLEKTAITEEKTSDYDPRTVYTSNFSFGAADFEILFDSDPIIGDNNIWVLSFILINKTSETIYLTHGAGTIYGPDEKRLWADWDYPDDFWPLNGETLLPYSSLEGSLGIYLGWGWETWWFEQCYYGKKEDESPEFNSSKVKCIGNGSKSENQSVRERYSFQKNQCFFQRIESTYLNTRYSTVTISGKELRD